MILDDNAGLFWSAPVRQLRSKGAREKNAAARIAALPWDTTDYIQPELRDAPPGCIALDFETDDPTLLERGSAWAFSGIGDVIGMAIAWDGFEAYYPIGHREGNTDREKTVAWLTEHFKRSDIRVLCANAVYDLGWAKRITGLYPAGGVCDVQFMAALLDEYRLSYSLDAIARDYLGVGKATDVVEDIAKKLGLKKYDVMGNLKQLPGAVIAPYASTDARITYDVYNVLLPKILDEGLLTVHELESALIPMSVEMKRRGIRVNVDEAARVSDDIKNRRMPELQDEIKRQTGIHVEPWEGETCERALLERGIVCDRTRTGQAKIDQYTLAEWAKTEPVAKHILVLRKMSKIQNTFLEGHILGHQHDGRIHADFNQLKSEREDGGSFGTVSGRYSSTAPNLQQIPTRDKEWGPLMRSLFLAEEGQQIASLDYSSQEPRLTVHFAAKANLPGAAEAVEKFRHDPRTDYHQMVAEIAKIPRSSAKTLNLGLAYGMSTSKLAHSLGLTTEWMTVTKNGRRSEWNKIDAKDVADLRAHGVDCVEVAGPEAKAILKQWEDGAPFIRGLFKLASEVAEKRGYIKTLLGRRCRFQIGRDGRYDYTHKALNRLAQGSAADQTKRGMLDLWNMGCIPLLTVHDELVFSVENETQAREYAPVMENAVKLEVPSIVDVNLGKTWGDVTK
jgi:DNA polymerase I-like protein with 3'-5' exonuclease and polymerase domains